MTKDQEIKELLSIKAMAEMLVEKADRLLEKKERPVSTGTSKNKMKRELEKFYLKRKKTLERRAIRNRAEKAAQKSKKTN